MKTELELQIKTATRKIDWIQSLTGWGCGYVGVPPGHPWHGKEYDAIDCYAHGCLTYSEDHLPKEKPDGLWWVGFDTAHLGDTPETWPKENVELETEHLKTQAIAAMQT